MNTVLKRTILFVTLILLVSALPAQGQFPRTEHERSGSEVYTSYDNMMLFLLDIKRSTSEMFLGSYGTSILGNDLPYAVFSRSGITNLLNEEYMIFL